jgi:hypothetical protein
MPKAGSKWSTMEIQAKGRDLSIMFDGKKTASVRSGVHTEGPVALQFGEGVVKFARSLSSRCNCERASWLLASSPSREREVHPHLLRDQSMGRR